VPNNDGVISQAQRLKSRKTASKEVRLQAAAEDGQWWCTRDMLLQTVRKRRKGSVADSGQPRTAHNQPVLVYVC